MSLAPDRGHDDGRMRDIEIRDGGIRLGQLLKIADVVGSGADVKELLAAGEVRVNGEVETRRGRQLVTGDVVDAGEQLRVVGPES
jgi:ribosome-associated protein